MKKILSLLLIIAFTITLSSCGDKEPTTEEYFEAFKESIGNGNYSEAINIYKNNLEGNDEIKFEEIEDIVYPVFKKELDDYKKSDSDKVTFSFLLAYKDVSPKLSEIANEYRDINESKSNYKDGMEFYEQGDYVSAAWYLYNVDKEIKQYEEAQNTMQILCEKLVPIIEEEVDKDLSGYADDYDINAMMARNTLLEYVDYYTTDNVYLLEDVINKVGSPKDNSKQGLKEWLIEEQARKQDIEDIDVEAIKRATENLDIQLGMTTDEVLNSKWGEPESKNKTTSVYGNKEQWVYPNYKYLYFEDGILTTIQE